MNKIIWLRGMSVKADERACALIYCTVALLESHASWHKFNQNELYRHCTIAGQQNSEFYPKHTLQFIDRYDNTKCTRQWYVLCQFEIYFHKYCAQMYLHICAPVKCFIQYINAHVTKWVNDFSKQVNDVNILFTLHIIIITLIRMLLRWICFISRFVLWPK